MTHLKHTIKYMSQLTSKKINYMWEITSRHYRIHFKIHDGNQ